jgi:NADPH2:quinone reductase
VAPPNGGLAEQAVALEERLLPIPDAIDDATAAALHVTYQTAWFALHHRARVREGETVLVHAGAGGTGSATIQLAAASGARVIATAGGPDKVALCHDHGADVAIDYRSDDVSHAVLDATRGEGADVIVDPVGGSTFLASTKCVAFEGRIVVVGFAGGEQAELRTGHVFVKNYEVLGLHWPLYEAHRPDLVREVHDRLISLLEAGLVSPTVSAVRPLPEAPDALTDLAAGRTTGKVVIRP